MRISSLCHVFPLSLSEFTVTKSRRMYSYPFFFLRWLGDEVTFLRPHRYNGMETRFKSRPSSILLCSPGLKKIHSIASQENERGGRSVRQQRTQLKGTEF